MGRSSSGRWVALGAAVALLGPVVASARPPADGAWHAVLLAGDAGSRAFDNARHELGKLLVSRGVDHVVGLSTADAGVEPGVGAASVRDLAKALASLRLGPDDRCVVHLTSHGTRAGVALGGRGRLTPETLDQLLDATCAERPTVVLVSACYSGNFASSPAMRAPNRVVLTAARDDRTSFGCGVEDAFTFWDGCLLEALPAASTWRDVYDTTRACVERKEAGGGFVPSEPQAFFGGRVAELPVFDGPLGADVGASAAPPEAAPRP